MKKAILIMALALIGAATMAQRTIPVKNKLFIEKISGHITMLGIGFDHHYDYAISPIINGKAYSAWANKYHGKWYSNYPYTIVFAHRRNQWKLYDGSKLIYVTTAHFTTPHPIIPIKSK